MAFTELVTDLTPGTYYYCAIGSNEAGLGYGEVLTFEVPDDTEPPGPDPDGDGGCGCRVASDSSGGAASISVVALFLLALRRRRRRAA